MCNNVSTNGHAWKTPAQFNPGFVCGKLIGGPVFYGDLGSKNGVGAAQLEFQYALLLEHSGGYSELMVKACKRLGMKPVCDHPSYCRNNAHTLYLGQSGHLGARSPPGPVLQMGSSNVCSSAKVCKF
jgi:hypothetical protein